MFYLKRNLPTWERAARVVAALAIAGLATRLPGGPMSWLAAGSAAVLLLTGFVGFCPGCALVGRRLPGPKP